MESHFHMSMLSTSQAAIGLVDYGSQCLTFQQVLQGLVRLNDDSDYIKNTLCISSDFL
jgi:hypothetical protein